jgi:hypothetical protein
MVIISFALLSTTLLYVAMNTAGIFTMVKVAAAAWVTNKAFGGVSFTEPETKPEPKTLQEIIVEKGLEAVFPTQSHSQPSTTVNTVNNIDQTVTENATNLVTQHVSGKLSEGAQALVDSFLSSGTSQAAQQGDTDAAATVNVVESKDPVIVDASQEQKKEEKDDLVEDFLVGHVQRPSVNIEESKGAEAKQQAQEQEEKEADKDTTWAEGFIAKEQHKKVPTVAQAFMNARVETGQKKQKEEEKNTQVVQASVTEPAAKLEQQNDFKEVWNAQQQARQVADQATQVVKQQAQQTVVDVVRSNPGTAAAFAVVGALTVGGAYLAYQNREEIVKTVANFFTTTGQEKDNLAAESNLDELKIEVAEIEKVLLELKKKYEEYEAIAPDEFDWWYGNVKNNAKTALLNLAYESKHFNVLFPGDKDLLDEIAQLVTGLDKEKVKAKANEIVEGEVSAKIGEFGKGISTQLESNNDLAKLKEFVREQRASEYGLFINVLSTTTFIQNTETISDLPITLTNTQVVRGIAQEVVEKLEGRIDIRNMVPETEYFI